MHASTEPEPPDCPRCGRSRPADIQTTPGVPAAPAWFRCRYCAYIWTAEGVSDRGADDTA